MTGGQAKVNDAAVCTARTSGVHVMGERCDNCYHSHCAACEQCQRCNGQCLLRPFHGRQGKLASRGKRLR